MSRAGSFSCLTLHRMGVAWPPLLPKAPVVSCTTFSPLLLRAVCLCGPIHNLTTIQGLPGILLYGVRTFLTIKRAHLADLSILRIADGRGKVKCGVLSGCEGVSNGYDGITLTLIINLAWWE